MIPKVIHYCWFGGNELPELAMKCIDSWKKFCPDYEIKQWNEKNYDLDSSGYIKEAYKNKKWAFVSDYARLDIIYNNGGIYLDTDVELIGKLDEFLDEKCFLAAEREEYVNTGLGFGAEKGNVVIKELLDQYNEIDIKSENENLFLPCPIRNTEPLLKKGYKFSKDKIWRTKLVTVYPAEYFCPIDYVTGEKYITNLTKSIHHYSASWHNKEEEKIHKIQEKCIKVLGIDRGKKVSRILDFPYRIKLKYKKLGLIGTLRFAQKKLKNN